MRKLEDLQEMIGRAVEKLDYPFYPAALYEPISYILSLGGKRMRPALLLMACDLFGGNVEAAIPPALAIEVFHNFTLMHDDIMDNAPLRRGKVTVHKKWNSNCGHIVGRCDAELEGYKLMMLGTPAIYCALYLIFLIIPLWAFARVSSSWIWNSSSVITLASRNTLK